MPIPSVDVSGQLMLTVKQQFCNIKRNRSLVFALAFRDLTSKYAGTLGGWVWALALPLATVVIFYFVFVVGFKAQGSGTAPYILWFICGLVPWLFFAETLPAMTNTITSNAPLVKKTIFPTEILPLVHLISGLVPHGIFLLILAGMIAFFKVPFVADRLLVIYFLACSCALLISLGWMLSALQVFYRDISHGLAIVINMLFWITPIAWPQDIMPAEYRALFSYNPVHYIVEGYRGLLIYNTVVWPSAGATAYFWGITALVFTLGSYVFRRLKPEFADVL